MSNETRTPVIECRSLEKTYNDGSRELRILRGIDLAVHDGDLMVITGPSGVGKSTLLHIIGTLDRPSSGDVLFRGTSLRKTGRAAINRIRNEEIGFVFQFYHLLPEFTALENVMMPALSRGKRRSQCQPRAEELLRTVGLTERMEHKPGQLSGGEQQRASIARAMEDMRKSYGNPFDEVIKRHVAQMIDAEILAVYRPVLEAGIKEALARHMTDEVVEKIISTSLQRLIGRY